LAFLIKTGSFQRTCFVFSIRKKQPGKVNPARLFLCLFDRITEDLACPFDTLLIGVGVHP